jgi:ethanolamine ammonia-lyase large subunit
MSKFGTITFEYFLKGDYVRTPDGVGIVAKDEDEIKTALELIYSDILIQHKYGNSNNTNNAPIMIERSCVLRIIKDEYDKEIF